MGGQKGTAGAGGAGGGGGAGGKKGFWGEFRGFLQFGRESGRGAGGGLAGPYIYLYIEFRTRVYMGRVGCVFWVNSVENGENCAFFHNYFIQKWEGENKNQNNPKFLGASRFWRPPPSSPPKRRDCDEKML